MEVTHLNQHELARRWKLSERTLERWRWLGVGPTYLKLGGRVVYRLADIETFEAQNVKQIECGAALAPYAGKAGVA